jgi:glutaredoxin
MAIEPKHVDGEDKGEVILYALSTCIWCGKTKKLLNELNVKYQYIDVDLLDFDEQQEALKELKKFNPNSGFPTMIINNKDCIIGFSENKIRERFQ